MKKYHNNIFIITGPSGAGEDSVIKGLKEKMEIKKIITSTSREKRSGEENGQDYYFLDRESFKQKIKEGKFFEWAEEDNGNLYGCTFEEIERVKKQKKPTIWKIDYKGVISAKEIMPEAISIYISIPMETIRKRLEKRGNHSPEFIEKRMEYAKGWFENEDKFDYKIENKENQLEQTIEKVANIIEKSLKNQ